MTSLCNYSHPELFNTDGLERHGVGTLFPYNPDLYDTASGLYGLGSLVCWYLLLASFLVNFAFCPIDEHGHRRPCVTTDLIALIVYPVFAATDALVQAIRMLGAADRGKVLFCLRYPTVDASLEMHGPGTPGDAPLDLHDIPKDVIEYGQRIIALSGPMPVCNMFTTAAFFALIIRFFWSPPGWKPTRAVWRLVSAAYVYVLGCAATVVFSTADLDAVCLLALYDTITPTLFLVVHGFGVLSCLAILVLLGMMLFKTVQLCVGQMPADSMGLLETFGGILSLALIMAMPYAVNLWKGHLAITPDLGIAVTESDQLAALMAGIITLCSTIYGVIENEYGNLEKTVGSGEEMQPLATSV
ncbi:hypothetical protein MN608_11317 [Microdochium nivale]|nr:hypothetical protein MN608_11317 [Microdochium nivale]